MLNAVALTETLRNALCTGISNIFLFNKDGMLLASAQTSDKPKTLSAVLSLVWGDYCEVGERSEDLQDPKSMIVQGEDGIILMGTIASLIVCI
jgi:hypothetical protein